MRSIVSVALILAISVVLVWGARHGRTERSAHVSALSALRTRQNQGTSGARTRFEPLFAGGDVRGSAAARRGRHGRRDEVIDERIDLDGTHGQDPRGRGGESRSERKVHGARGTRGSRGSLRARARLRADVFSLDAEESVDDVLCTEDGVYVRASTSPMSRLPRVGELLVSGDDWACASAEAAPLYRRITGEPQVIDDDVHYLPTSKNLALSDMFDEAHYRVLVFPRNVSAALQPSAQRKRAISATQAFGFNYDPASDTIIDPSVNIFTGGGVQVNCKDCFVGITYGFEFAADLYFIGVESFNARAFGTIESGLGFEVTADVEILDFDEIGVIVPPLFIYKLAFSIGPIPVWIDFHGLVNARFTASLGVSSSVWATARHTQNIEVGVRYAKGMSAPHYWSALSDNSPVVDGPHVTFGIDAELRVNFDFTLRVTPYSLVSLDFIVSPNVGLEIKALSSSECEENVSVKPFWGVDFLVSIPPLKFDLGLFTVTVTFGDILPWYSPAVPLVARRYPFGVLCIGEPVDTLSTATASVFDLSTYAIARLHKVNFTGITCDCDLYISVDACNDDLSSCSSASSTSEISDTQAKAGTYVWDDYFAFKRSSNFDRLYYKLWDSDSWPNGDDLLVSLASVRSTWSCSSPPVRSTCGDRIRCDTTGGCFFFESYLVFSVTMGRWMATIEIDPGERFFWKVPPVSASFTGVALRLVSDISWVRIGAVIDEFDNVFDETASGGDRALDANGRAVNEFYVPGSTHDFLYKAPPSTGFLAFVSNVDNSVRASVEFRATPYVDISDGDTSWHTLGDVSQLSTVLVIARVPALPTEATGVVVRLRSDSGDANVRTVGQYAALGTGTSDSLYLSHAQLDEIKSGSWLKLFVTAVASATNNVRIRVSYYYELNMFNDRGDKVTLTPYGSVGTLNGMYVMVTIPPDVSLLHVESDECSLVLGHEDGASVSYGGGSRYLYIGATVGYDIPSGSRRYYVYTSNCDTAPSLSLLVVPVYSAVPGASLALNMLDDEMITIEIDLWLASSPSATVLANGGPVRFLHVRAAIAGTEYGQSIWLDAGPIFNIGGPAVYSPSGCNVPPSYGCYPTNGSLEFSVVDGSAAPFGCSLEYAYASACTAGAGTLNVLRGSGEQLITRVYIDDEDGVSYPGLVTTVVGINVYVSAPPPQVPCDGVYHDFAMLAGERLLLRFNQLCWADGMVVNVLTSVSDSARVAVGAPTDPMIDAPLALASGGTDMTLIAQSSVVNEGVFLAVDVVVDAFVQVRWTELVAPSLIVDVSSGSSLDAFASASQVNITFTLQGTVHEWDEWAFALEPVSTAEELLSRVQSATPSVINTLPLDVDASVVVLDAQTIVVVVDPLSGESTLYDAVWSFDVTGDQPSFGVPQSLLRTWSESLSFTVETVWSALTTASPTVSPSRLPTTSPTSLPTYAPTNAPTKQPTEVPTELPTSGPSLSPTRLPTDAPSVSPTKLPTDTPTRLPTNAPSVAPTRQPTDAPSVSPTKLPTLSPTPTPTEAPTMPPTLGDSADAMNMNGDAQKASDDVAVVAGASVGAVLCIVLLVVGVLFACILRRRSQKSALAKTQNVQLSSPRQFLHANSAHRRREAVSPRGARSPRGAHSPRSPRSPRSARSHRSARSPRSPRKKIDV